jgi:hypothetical protein
LAISEEVITHTYAWKWGDKEIPKVVVIAWVLLIMVVRTVIQKVCNQ